MILSRYSEVKMKKGICLGSVPGGTIREKFELAKDAGFQGVEPGAALVQDEKSRAELKDAAAATGLEIPSIMGGKHWQCPLSSPSEETRKECMEDVEATIRLAKTVGADTVLLVPGVVTDDVTYEEAYARSSAAIKKLAKTAEEHQVYIAVENVWNKFLLSPMEFCKFVDDIESPYVQAYFDVGNILLYGYPQHWIRSLGKRIKKVHVKDFKLGNKSFVWLLEGDVNWKEVAKAFKEIGYDDYVTVEVPPYPHHPEEMVYDMSRHLSRILEG